MKTSIQILTLLALGSTLALAEEGKRKHHDGPGGPGGPERPPFNPQEMFKRLDKDGSGGVSLDEFKSSPKGQENPERATKMFGHLDADGDGQLTIDEFAKMHRPRDGGGDRPNPEEIVKHLDTDKNGTVSLEEFKAGPRAQKNPDKAAEIFGKMDADGDGQLTVDEFARFHGDRKGRDGDGKGDRPGDGDRRDGKERPKKNRNDNAVE